MVREPTQIPVFGKQAFENCRLIVGRIEVRVLAHFELHFFALAFVVQQDHAVAEVAAFDQTLGAAEHFSESAEFADGVFAHFLEPVGAFGTEAREDDVVVQRQELAYGAGIALSPAASRELSIDAGGVVQFGANHVQTA